MAEKAERMYRIIGRVIDRSTQRGLEEHRIEVWDKDRIYNDLIGSAITTEEGTFQMEFDESYFQELFADRRPDLFFKIYLENELIESTEDSVLWNTEAGEIPLTIGIVPWPKIEISSFDELIQHEKEVLDRISQTPNGGNLFMVHPFMLLADVGVELAEKVQQEIIKDEPQLSGLSATPYNALKASQEKQKVRFHLHGLFQRRSQ